MAAATRLAVTGSTGFVGGEVARILETAGVAQRLLVRTVAKAPRIAGATVMPFSYADPDASLAALDGIATLFMVSGTESSDRLDQHKTFIDSAARAGVRHIVYTSFIGAAPDTIFTLGRDHYATEQHIRASGMDFTFLRDNFYLDFVSSLPGADGVIRGPADGGACSFVARTDVARVAAAILQKPSEHVGATYDLTGPEALTMAEVAAILSEVRDQSVSFYNETVSEAYESRLAWDAPDWQYDAWVSTYTAIAAGGLAMVSGDVERITDRKPLSLKELLVGDHDHGGGG